MRRGIGLADARAMHPVIEVIETDPVADRRLLDGLADWCDRYTPLVAIDGEDGLILDITGCAHLFGGESALLSDLLSRLFHQGFDARAGLAATPGAAWAVARCRTAASGDARIIAEDGEAAALEPLPLAALRLDPETVTKLESVGLRTVGTVMAAPRAPLARRFGSRLLARLDQALGQLGEPISPRLAVPSLSAERRLSEPVSLAEDVEHLAFMLCGTLRMRLEELGEGARALELALFRIDGVVHRIAVGTSRPVRDPAVVRRLFRERLASLAGGIEAECGYEMLRLSVLASAPFDAMQADLGGAGTPCAEDLACLVDRIHARLGRTTVLRPLVVASHIPERAVRHVPFREAEKAASSDASPARGLAPRPVRLFSDPEPVEAMAEIPEGPPVMFRWRRALYRVAAAEGPERLAPEWWQDSDGRTRDYYRIEDQSGRRYWLYRQGLYGDGAGTPRWFMHGIFA